MMVAMTTMKTTAWKRLVLGLCLAAALAAVPATARASSSDDEAPTVYDARIQGYSQNVQLDSGSTALSWLLLCALGVVCLGVTFKDAKRSHLD
jgi:hypothetical protein